MIPFEEYVFNISFSHFSLWQLKASSWLELVKFSFTKFSYLAYQLLIHLNFWISSWHIVSAYNIFHSSISRWSFLNYFGLSYAMAIFYIVMGNLNVGNFKYFSNERSRFLSSILSGIPVISILFLRSCCSTEFVAVSRIMTSVL